MDTLSYKLVRDLFGKVVVRKEMIVCLDINGFGTVQRVLDYLGMNKEYD